MIGGAVLSHAVESGDAMTTGPGGHGELQGGPRMPPHWPDGGADGQGNREGRRESMCRFCHGSPQGVRGAYIK